MLMFEDMLKVYSGPAAIFSNLSLQKRYFLKFYYFSDHVYFQLPWFLKRAVAEALKLQKMTVTFRHKLKSVYYRQGSKIENQLQKEKHSAEMI